MPEHHHHHHHHRRKDSATLFKERSLNAIRYRRMFAKWLKIFLVVVAAIMMVTVFMLYYVLK